MSLCANYRENKDGVQSIHFQLVASITSREQYTSIFKSYGYMEHIWRIKFLIIKEKRTNE